jgi:hypothetical protein
MVLGSQKGNRHRAGNLFLSFSTRQMLPATSVFLRHVSIFKNYSSIPFSNIELQQIVDFGNPLGICILTA